MTSIIEYGSFQSKNPIIYSILIVISLALWSLKCFYIIKLLFPFFNSFFFPPSFPECCRFLVAISFLCKFFIILLIIMTSLVSHIHSVPFSILFCSLSPLDPSVEIAQFFHHIFICLFKLPRSLGVICGVADSLMALFCRCDASVPLSLFFLSQKDMFLCLQILCFCNMLFGRHQFLPCC